jgi:hypothetical protein
MSEMKTNYLITMSADWSDEFQAEEFTIHRSELSLDELKDALREALNTDEEFYFGTNEFFTADELHVDQEIKVKEITFEQACDLAILLTPPFGTGVLDQILENLPV